MKPKDPQPKSWLDRLSQALLAEPQNRDELMSILRDASLRHVIPSETIAMLEAVVQFVEMQARDIMIPRGQMVVFDEDNEYQTILTKVIESGHSRFPVLNTARDNIIGILHAKDLLNPQDKFDLKDILYPPVIIPESKRLDVLLREFRNNRNHMAIVVDEYGVISGFITIEDVLEQIVGDIEDEFDADEEAFVKKHSDTEFIVKAHMPLEDFNEYFNSNLNHEDIDTIGGLIINTLGHLPKRGETIHLAPFSIDIIHADNRRVRLLKLRLE